MLKTKLIDGPKNLLWLTVLSLVSACTSPPPRPDLGTSQPDQGQMTNSAALNLIWNVDEQKIKKQNGIIVKIPAAAYQISLPFSDYEAHEQVIVPSKNYQLGDNYDFNFHVDFKAGALADQAKINLIGWTGLSADLHGSLQPIESVQIPSNNMLGTLDSLSILSHEHKQKISQPYGMLRVYKPITVTRNKRSFASINGMVFNENQIVNNDTMSIALNGSFNEMNINDLNATYGPGQFSFIIHGLNTRVVTELEREIFELQHVSAEKRIQSQLTILSHIKSLCRQDSQVEGKFSLKTPHGEIKDEYEFYLADLLTDSMRFSKLIPFMLGSLSENKAEQVAVSLPALDAVRGHRKFSIPKKDMLDFMELLTSERMSYQTTRHEQLAFTPSEMFSHISEFLHTSIKRGLLVDNNDYYTSDIHINQGTIRAKKV